MHEPERITTVLLPDIIWALSLLELRNPVERAKYCDGQDCTQARSERQAGAKLAFGNNHLSSVCSVLFDSFMQLQLFILLRYLFLGFGIWQLIYSLCLITLVYNNCFVVWVWGFPIVPYLLKACWLCSAKCIRILGAFTISVVILPCMFDAAFLLYQILPCCDPQSSLSRPLVDCYQHYRCLRDDASG